VAALVAVAVAMGCSPESDGAREARRVFADASPPGAGACWAGSVQRPRDAFETSCELTLSTDWNEYKRWLQSRLEPQYQTRAETRTSIAFSRGVEGDLDTVTATLTSDKAPESVKIRFRAAPG
jgi:hypothetical protein